MSMTDEVWVGPNPPTDPDAELWYDTDAVGTIPPVGGGVASVNGDTGPDVVLAIPAPYDDTAVKADVADNTADIAAVAQASLQGDTGLDTRVSALESTPPYDDTAIRADLAAEEAARTAADDAKVNKSGDTMTGDLTIQAKDGPTSGTVLTVRSDNNAFVGRLRARDDGGFWFQTNAGGLPLKLEADRTVDMTGASAVKVPPISGTGVNQAAQVTAYDAPTGRLAIGGIEMGDTGWREVSSLLNGTWTASNIWLRRCGADCFMQARQLTGGADADLIVNGPTGFTSNTTTSAPFLYSTSALLSSNPTMKQGYVQGVDPLNIKLADTDDGSFVISWPTDAPWPASLPGTAA